MRRFQSEVEWGYALETAAFTLNRAPSKSVEMTPYELFLTPETVGESPTANLINECRYVT